jgi:phosphoadenosine phosphosulfate reductase
MLIDVCSKVIAEHSLEPLTVACIDTDFFFPETLELRDRLVEKYQGPIDFVTWKTSVTPEQQADQYGAELWKSNKDLCCNIRKVQPMVENIKPYKVWITGLRRTQTEHRAQQPVISFDWRYHVHKFCPLVSWTRADVWKYVQEHDVPFNPLHLQNYPSIGCTHCTKKVLGSTPEDDARDGRWEGNEKTECGLHYDI